MDDKKPVDTLRLSPGDRHRLLKRMDERLPIHTSQSRRAHPRLLCEFRSDPVIRIRQYDGQEITYVSLARDLSADGMGFIHGCYLYPTTPVRITLTALDGERACVDGEVIHCEHVEGRFHEVGVKFGLPIDTHLFVTVNEETPDSPSNPAFCEAMKSINGLTEAVHGLKAQVSKAAGKDSVLKNLEQVCDLFTQARMQILNVPES